ncbi:Na+/H+ antiporter subunit E [Microbulbifer sp. S227A]|uniref:Na+/H+ antiporter subunit E n=1 Tax=Microbulbifer sp. S227A TaxID=3415131 RepID=UPI003C7AEAC2
MGKLQVRLIGTAIFLSALWLLMSGLFKPLLLVFGAVSVLLVVYVLHRMDRVDEDRVALPLGPVASLRYFLWLLVEIAKANWAVTKIVLSPRMPITQHLFAVPYTQKSDVGQVIFANSITLTPGTLTVETDLGYFLVHALDYAPDDLAALADMDAHVTAIETGRAG